MGGYVGEGSGEVKGVGKVEIERVKRYLERKVIFALNLGV